MNTYRIVPVFDSGLTAPGVSPSGSPQIIGVRAQVPDRDSTMSSAAKVFTEEVEAAASQNRSTIRARTFIPQDRLDAPIIGCEYGSSYQFEGDGRSYSPYSSDYRTSLMAHVGWDDEGGGPRLALSGKDVGTTIVYDKSTGEEVDRQTESADQIEVSQLGADADKVDLRFSIYASNPFCEGDAIAGQFTMNAYKSGSWIIRSGSHRMMPHWEIYISWLDGVPNTVYKRDYFSVYCLVNLLCEDAPMSAAGETYDWEISGRLFNTNDEGLAACQNAGRHGVEAGYWSDYNCLQNDSVLSLVLLDPNFEDTALIFADLTDCVTRGAVGISDGSYAAVQCRQGGSLGWYHLWAVYA